MKPAPLLALLLAGCTMTTIPWPRPTGDPDGSTGCEDTDTDTGDWLETTTATGGETSSAT